MIDQLKIQKALDLALFLHANQKSRPDGPYTNHILRVTNRILEDFAIKDTDIIVAASLHDSIEDQADKLADKLNTQINGLTKRQKALKYIEQEFGQKAATIIEAVTNPENLEELDPSQRNKQYINHVKKAVENKDVFYVKLSDFMDNGMKIENIGDRKKQFNLAKKYLPLYSILIKRLKSEDIALPTGKKEEIINELSKVEKSARNILSLSQL